MTLMWFHLTAYAELSADFPDPTNRCIEIPAFSPKLAAE